MSWNYIKIEEAERIGTIRFANDAKRNALNGEMIDEILSAFTVFGRTDVRAVIMRSDSGGKVWSAGHDIEELPRAERDPLPWGDPLVRLFRAVRRFRAPVIAMVHGSVWGAACDLTMSCDIVIADETATFAITPTKLGLPYNASGILHFMNRLPLNVVNEMFFTAEPIDAVRAERFGIINKLVPSTELAAQTLAMAKVITTRSPQSIAAIKAQAQVLADAIALNPSTYEHLQSIRHDVYFGSDYREGIQAFLEKRPPNFSQPD